MGMGTAAGMVAGRAFAAAVGRLPARWGHALVRPMAWVSYLSFRHFNARAARSAALLTGNAAVSGRERRRRVLGMYRFFYAQAVALMALCRADAATRAAFFAPAQGLEYLREALAQGRGVVLIAGHVGYFTLLAPALAAAGHPEAGTVMRPFRHPLIETLLQRIRERLGLRWFNQRDGHASLAALKAWLRGNGVVILFMDQRTRAGVPVLFLGVDKQTAPGPAMLAMRHACPVLPVVNVRLPDGRCQLHIGAPVPIARTRAAGGDVRHNTHQCMQAVEATVRAHPEQWFSFTPWWEHWVPPADRPGAQVCAPQGAVRVSG